LKLLIDARMAFPPRHGIARYTMNLIRGLKGHADIHLLIHSKEAERFFRSETPWIDRYILTHVPFANPLDSIELSVRIPPIYDVVHFTSFSVPLRLPHRSVVTIHDLIHLKEGSSWLHKIYYKTVVRRALKKCSLIISVSEWTKNDLIKEFTIDPAKICVIPNGLESQWFAESPIVPSESKFRQSRNLQTNYICCVSNIKPHKNLQTLLSSCEELWNQGHQFELALAIGQDRLPPSLKINPLYLPRIKTLTQLSEQELMALYRYALVTISPSQYEGYGFPVAESLAMGTPVVLSRTSAHAEFEGEGLNFYEPFNSSSQLEQALRPLLKQKKAVQKLPKQVIDHLELSARTLEAYRLALRS